MHARRIIDRHALAAAHQANGMTGEAPFWDQQTGKLWWIDIQGQRLLGYGPSGHEEVHNLPSMPGLVAARRSGGLVIGLEDGWYALDPAMGLGERLLAVEADDPRTRLNYGKPDLAGRLWFGSMDKTGAGAPIGSLYRADGPGAVHQQRRNVAVPNAIGLSPDGATFYFADSRTRTLEASAYDVRTGEVSGTRMFVRYPEGEAPDGICIDSEGALWVVVVGGSRLERRLPDGALDTVVELPVSRPNMPMLGGTDGRTLFVTSQRRGLTPERLRAEPFAGDLFAIRVASPASAVVSACAF